MTNHAVTATRSRQAEPRRFDFAALYRNWKVRRQVSKLQDRDDRTLDDIGVTRDEVIWASYLPLSVNAAHELEKAAYRRRKERQLMWL